MNQEHSLADLQSAVWYEPETGLFYNRAGKWRVEGARADNANVKGYRTVTIRQKQFLAHRLAYVFMTGAWPAHQIDHINGDKADNRWSNLRAATPTQNTANSRAPASNTSGFRGVRWSKQYRKWEAKIKIERKNTYLGRFDRIEDAARAYRDKAVEVHGDFVHPDVLRAPARAAIAQPSRED